MGSTRSSFPKIHCLGVKSRPLQSQQEFCQSCLLFTCWSMATCSSSAVLFTGVCRLRGFTVAAVCHVFAGLMLYPLQTLLILSIYCLFYSITYPCAFPESFGADELVVQSWRIVMVLAAQGFGIGGRWLTKQTASTQLYRKRCHSSISWSPHPCKVRCFTSLNCKPSLFLSVHTVCISFYIHNWFPITRWWLLHRPQVSCPAPFNPISCCYPHASPVKCEGCSW